MSVCNVCFRKCNIKDGDKGFCGVRMSLDGRVVPTGYGRITSLALDPIEKKPLNRFMPGSKILSAGSYGCNLRCPFCQNSEISWSKQAYRYETEAEYLTPEEKRINKEKDAILKLIDEKPEEVAWLIKQWLMEDE